MVLPGISLMANDVEHLLMCLFAVCIFFLVECLFVSTFYFESCMFGGECGRATQYFLVLFGSEWILRVEISGLRLSRREQHAYTG